MSRTKRKSPFVPDLRGRCIHRVANWNKKAITCLCTAIKAIKAKVLNLSIYVPIMLKLLPCHRATTAWKERWQGIKDLWGWGGSGIVN
jgi:hypothetical protein